MLKMNINGKIINMTIEKMICKDCAYRFKNTSQALQVLNCQKFPQGKPYHPNLTKNRCLFYISDDGQEIETSYKKLKKEKREKKKKLKEKYKH